MKKISFPEQGGFYQEIKNRVNAYFHENKISTSGDWRMFLKTAIILAWFIVSYVLLVFGPSSLLFAVIAAVALAKGSALIGFNIMHDGNHGSYSKNPKINKFMGYTLNLVGASHWFWRYKHNILHHTYTNITELDDDMRVGTIMRLSPAQEWRPWHRFQCFYAFPAYGFMTLGWVIIGDFMKFFSGRIGEYKLPKISAAQTVSFFLSKSIYFGYMLVLPMFFHPVLHVILAFLFVQFILGFSIAIIFQLAHIVEDNAFPVPVKNTGHVESEWAIHQVETTADFAPTNKLAAWCLGGLNFQIEHHLFPRICHIHYPAISKIVANTCQEYGISYISYPSIRKAILAHYRFLKNLGYKEPVPVV